MSRAQHRFSEQLKSNRSALAELTEHSPVRDIIEQVIQALVVQLKELEKQLRAAVSARMPSLLDLPGVGPVVAGTMLAGRWCINLFSDRPEACSVSLSDP